LDSNLPATGEEINGGIVSDDLNRTHLEDGDVAAMEAKLALTTALSFNMAEDTPNQSWDSQPRSVHERGGDVGREAWVGQQSVGASVPTELIWEKDHEQRLPVYVLQNALRRIILVIGP